MHPESPSALATGSAVLALLLLYDASSPFLFALGLCAELVSSVLPAQATGALELVGGVVLACLALPVAVFACDASDCCRGGTDPPWSLNARSCTGLSEDPIGLFVIASALLAYTSSVASRLYSQRAFPGAVFLASRAFLAVLLHRTRDRALAGGFAGTVAGFAASCLFPFLRTPASAIDAALATISLGKERATAGGDTLGPGLAVGLAAGGAVSAFFAQKAIVPTPGWEALLNLLLRTLAIALALWINPDPPLGQSLRLLLVLSTDILASLYEMGSDDASSVGYGAVWAGSGGFLGLQTAHDCFAGYFGRAARLAPWIRPSARWPLGVSAAASLFLSVVAATRPRTVGGKGGS